MGQIFLCKKQPYSLVLKERDYPSERPICVPYPEIVMLFFRPWISEKVTQQQLKQFYSPTYSLGH